MRPLHALLLFLCLFLASPRAHADSVAVEAIASLADPAKLATLGERQANPRVQKITYWLATARAGGERPDAVIDSALARFGWKGTPRGDITKAAMLRNLDIAEKLGCLDQNGLEQMRGGRSPIVRRGPYTGDKLSVDHIIPFAVMPELDHVLANLELMPLRMNESKTHRSETGRLTSRAASRRPGCLPRKRRNRPQRPRRRQLCSLSLSRLRDLRRPSRHTRTPCDDFLNSARPTPR